MIYCRVAAIPLAVLIFDILLVDLGIDVPKPEKKAIGIHIMTYSRVLVLKGRFSITCKTMSYSFFKNREILRYRRRMCIAFNGLHVSQGSETQLKRPETHFVNI